MNTDIGWPDIVLRLICTVIAAGLIGINRGEHGRPAGLRTTVLVCLVASVAMIQANLLLGTVGKAGNSFATFDPMRLPLGVLTGVGFIGAGTILQRGRMVEGVTTAATLWFVTGMGLCFGGGQLFLGVAMLGLGLTVLWGFKRIEQHLSREHKAVFTIATRNDTPSEQELRTLLAQGGQKVSGCSVGYADAGRRRLLKYDIRWRALPGAETHPSWLEDLAKREDVLELRWDPR